MSLDPLTAGIDLAKTAINKIWPDKTEAEKAELAAAVTILQGQMAINTEEAKSQSVFVAGWRPFIGWVCGSALAYTYIGYPFLIWVMSVWHPEIAPPKLMNDGMLYELMFGMLGMGGLRTFEKYKGVA
jgi:Holin of 3TMs, for gene-transfer release